MAVKGEKARVLVRMLLDAVSDLVPNDVAVEVIGSGKHCHISARRWVDPAQISREHPYGGGIAGSSSPWGIGPAIPLLSRRVAAKLTVEDALKQIQQAVSAVTQSPWPGPDQKVRVEASNNGVRAWFVDASGAVIDIGAFDYDLASNR